MKEIKKEVCIILAGVVFMLGAYQLGIIIAEIANHILPNRGNNKVLEEVSKGVFLDRDTQCYYLGTLKNLTPRLDKEGRIFCIHIKKQPDNVIK